MQIHLASATQQDLPLVLEWRRQMWQSDPAQSESPGRIIPEGAMARLIDDPAFGRLWVVRLDDQPVGFVALVFSFSIEFGGRVAFIDELFIDQSFRDRGIGRRAVELVVVESATLGVKELFLEVNEANAPATKIYERCGFAARKYRLMSRRVGDDVRQ